MTSLFNVTPSSALATLSWMSSVVLCAASALRIARFRTSSATTAKPLPASPARAASTAAFKASRLVWKAISSIVFTILAVWSLETLILSMASESRRMESAPFSVPWRAPSLMCLTSRALAALCSAMEDISCRLEATSSRVAACSDVAWARAWLPELIWSAALATWSAETATWPIPSSMALMTVLHAYWIWPYAPGHSPSMRTV